MPSMPEPSPNARAELHAAVTAATRWLDSVATRPVPPSEGIDVIAARLAAPLPRDGTPADQVIERLADGVEPGPHGERLAALLRLGHGRNPARRDRRGLARLRVGPERRDARRHPRRDRGRGARGDVAARPARPAGGCRRRLRDGRHDGATSPASRRPATRVLDRAGWDVAADGLGGAPRIRVLAGAERHSSIDLALRYLGLGQAELVAERRPGPPRRGARSARRSRRGDGPTIVCLQAGNVHSGRFDPFARCRRRRRTSTAPGCTSTARSGCGRAATPTLAAPHRRPRGPRLVGDRRPQDAQHALRLRASRSSRPRSACRRAMGAHASYLHGVRRRADPHENVPEFSRRARGVPVWAALASSVATGWRRSSRASSAARGIADGVGGVPGVACSTTSSTPRSASRSRRRRAPPRPSASPLLAEGADAAPTSWHGRAVIRFSVSNRATDAAAVAETVAAVARAVDATAAR